ncbi:hypothetical protein Tco_0853391 [Tanacetum coccineum]
MLLFIDYCSSEHYSSETLFTSRNCPSREGMEGKSFEEGLAEITKTLKRLQSTLLFHQTKLKESFRQESQDFSLARRDISLATEKLYRSIKAAIKEEVDHEEQFNFLRVQLNQRIPNRTVKARKVMARLFWRKFIVTIDRTRRPKSIQSVLMLRLGDHHPSVARGNIRVLGLNVQRVRKHLPRLVYQVCYWPILHYKGNQRQIWDPGITWLKISKEHLEDKDFQKKNLEKEWKGRAEEGLAEITETLKRLQSTLLFHQTKLKESFRQARQDFSLARRDISLATEKLHRSIIAAIKEEVDHEEQFDFLGVQLNQLIPNRTVKARKVKARLFWRKFIVTIDRTRRPKSIQSVVMLRLGHHHPSVARGNIRVLGLNVQRMLSKFVNSNTASSSSSGSLPSNTVTNPKEDLKGITTRSGVAYQGPTIPTSSPQVVERRTEVTKDIIFSTNNGITEDVQPSVVPVENQNPVFEPVDAPVSAPIPNQKPSHPKHYSLPEIVLLEKEWKESFERDAVKRLQTHVVFQHKLKLKESL